MPGPTCTRLRPAAASHSTSPFARSNRFTTTRWTPRSCRNSGSPAEAPAGAAIDVQDRPVGDEEEERVVGLLDEMAKQGLALAQGPCGLFASGGLARDLHEAREGAVRLPRRREHHARQKGRAVLAG